MPAAGGFITSFFPLFLVGAIFGQLMTSSGYATAVADLAMHVLGPRHALLVTVAATGLLTYGGVNGWVVVFTIFPIAMTLFQAADVPRRLMPGAVAFGVFTFASAALPGTPQVHNIIPTKWFGTDSFAAPGLGLLGSALVFGLGMLWLTYRERSLKAAGESFHDLSQAEQQGTTRSDDLTASWRESQEKEPGEKAPTSRGLLALLPILVVVAVNALMTYVVLEQMDTSYLAEEKFGGVKLSAVAALWSVTTAMVAGCLLIVLLNHRQAGQFMGDLSEGARNAVLPIFNTASEVGYGATIASLAAFAGIRDAVFGVSDNPVVTAGLSTSAVSAVTGSASGGLTIALEAFGEQLVQQAQDQGISMELMHRVSSMSAVSWDSLPHNGAIVTLLLVCGMSHRESYKDIFVLTVAIPFLGALTVAGLGLAVGAF